MDNRKWLIVVVAAAALAFGAGYFATPNKIEERIVYKESTEAKTEKKEDKVKIVYKERIVYKDGTIKETEREEERSSSDEQSSSKTNKESISEKKTTKDIGLTIQALAVIDDLDLSKKEYGVYVKKRVYSNISIGAMATTGKKIGLAVGLDF